jgi:hypothetical protein
MPAPYRIGRLPARHTARFGVPTTARLAVACIALAAVTPAAG